MQRFYAKNTFNVCNNIEYFLTWVVCLAPYLVCVGIGLWDAVHVQNHKSNVGSSAKYCCGLRSGDLFLRRSLMFGLLFTLLVLFGLAQYLNPLFRG